ncbi:hypothetical protein SBA1_1040054 [Candidatus Sulfotelmatobacter kueseliae]|uniref:Uncharacterized protein n=1 Tax=Candidatus Sulfotelmatobacter kueseliae TaxID=2042962 RepID=A0A2U3JXY1_9BACT|nr:hypothetical protein SBA1_1040054 [Candidatus Sulfotelmatobacter kueseliae]
MVSAVFRMRSSPRILFVALNDGTPLAFLFFPGRMVSFARSAFLFSEDPHLSTLFFLTVGRLRRY